MSLGDEPGWRKAREDIPRGTRSHGVINVLLFTLRKEIATTKYESMISKRHERKGCRRRENSLHCWGDGGVGSGSSSFAKLLVYLSTL